MSVIIALDMFFIGLFPEKQLVITQTDTAEEYLVNGTSESLRFGVAGDDNLFEPGEEIRVIIENLDGSLDGERAKITVTSDQNGFDKKGYVTFRSSASYSSFTFSSDKNGIFTVTIVLTDRTEYTFNVGVFPRNERANDSFYYGIQPYITRAYTWGTGFQLPDCSAEESVDKILDAAEYLGANLIREDSVGWSSMQSEAYGDIDFSVQDYLINKVTDRQMKYNWILGYNAGKWSAADRFKENYDESVGWTYAPDEEIWSYFAEKVAIRYASDPDIL